eukprot:CAMPEP_0184739842 /NCGR_PEP_ID=MMETSP0315-20130426/2761_1 /TAXON_ID=101924 /ORGANISM="Rhodosorus marinus, Strain UTEX LB 2760" /LENGTH=1065 /DNA_ID=CAMNT_0027209015 /DNA_START=406 /DNA_END=3603 /DNA_ORIENTATION=-
MKDKRARSLRIEDSFDLLYHLVDALRGSDQCLASKLLTDLEKSSQSIQRRVFLPLCDYGCSILHIAVTHASFSVLSTITCKVLDLKGDIDLRDLESGWTPLHTACYLRKPHFVRYLVSKGADPHKRDNGGNYPYDLLISDSYTSRCFEERRRYLENSGGNVLVMGSNASYQMGIGDNDVDVAMRPLTIDGLIGVRMTATGSKHTLILGVCGEVWAVGVGEGGRLGLGNENTKAEAEQVKGLSGDICFITVSERRSAAISTNGTMYVWGSGVLKPAKVMCQPKDIRFESAAIGDDYALAVDEAGRLWAWGRNDCNVLGLGHVVAHQPNPRYVTRFSKLRIRNVCTFQNRVSVVIGYDMALKRLEMYCWGKGVPSPTKVSLEVARPWAFYYPTDPLKVVLAGKRMYALTESNQVFSWAVGDAVARQNTMFHKRAIVDIAGNQESLLAVDQYGALLRMLPQGKSGGLIEPEGSYRGILSVAAARNHIVCIAAARKPALDSFPGTRAASCPDGSLRSLCASQLANEIAVENLCEIVEIARTLDDDPLIVSCARFAFSNLDLIMCHLEHTSPSHQMRALLALSTVLKRPNQRLEFCPDFEEEACLTLDAFTLPNGENPSNSEACVGSPKLSRMLKSARRKLADIEKLENLKTAGHKLQPAQKAKVNTKKRLVEDMTQLLDLLGADGLNTKVSDNLISEERSDECPGDMRETPTAERESGEVPKKALSLSPEAPAQGEAEIRTLAPTLAPTVAPTRNKKKNKKKKCYLDLANYGETAQSQNDLNSKSTTSVHNRWAIERCAGSPANGRELDTVPTPPRDSSLPTLQASCRGDDEQGLGMVKGTASPCIREQIVPGQVRGRREPQKRKKVKTNFFQLGGSPYQGHRYAPAKDVRSQPFSLEPLKGESASRRATGNSSCPWGESVCLSGIANLASIQDEELKKLRRGDRKKKTRPRSEGSSDFQSVDSVSGTSKSALSGESQGSASNQSRGWNVSRVCAQSIVDIQADEARRSATLRKPVYSRASPTERCWMPLPNDEPLKAKPLRKIETEEMALKAIKQHLKGSAVVRRVPS